jgi:hypothetical protein
MKYLCLVHLDGAKMSKLSDAEGKELDRMSKEYDSELERRGHFIAAAALLEPKTAVIVRPKGNDFSTTDGPFVEVKEHVGGFILIEARDLNEAISIAAKIPVAQYGAVEVRPVMEF